MAVGSILFQRKFCTVQVYFILFLGSPLVIFCHAGYLILFPMQVWKFSYIVFVYTGAVKALELLYGHLQQLD